MSKGSGRRPTTITVGAWQENWDRTFGGETTVPIAGPLIEAEKIDANNELFPKESMEVAVDKFNKMIETTGGFISVDFKPGIEAVRGRVTKLVMSGNKVSARGILWRDAENLAGAYSRKEIEMAVEGKIQKQHEEERDGKKIRVIDRFSISGVSLTKDKVK